MMILLMSQSNVARDEKGNLVHCVSTHAIENNRIVTKTTRRIIEPARKK